MATTSLEAVMEREWGFEGRVMVVGSLEGELRWWMWRVESHDAEISNAVLLSACGQLILNMNSTYNALCCTPPSSLVLHAHSAPSARQSQDSACSQSAFSFPSVLYHWETHLFTCQSMPAVKASLSSAPKHTSSTGARCSYFSISMPPAS